MSWEVRTSKTWPQIVKVTWSEDKERGVLALGARRLASALALALALALGVLRSGPAATFFGSGDCPVRLLALPGKKARPKRIAAHDHKPQSPHRCPLERDGDCTLRSVELFASV
jgi:hypothetical protein